MPHAKSPEEEAAKVSANSGKPTLKTIAKLSGLAVPTVSRALNDAPDIGRQTKELVRKIATEIGYVPNRAGVRLRTGRTNVISLVMSTEMDLLSHTARLIPYLTSGLRDTPFHLNITPFFPDEDLTKPVRYIVETGSADAIIMDQIQPEDPRVAYLMERGFPFATHGRTKWADQHPYYDYDNEAFGRAATARLVKRARKSILLVAPPPFQSYAQHMTNGVTKEAARNNIDLTLASAVNSDCPSADIISDVKAQLAERPETDAIIVGSTSAALAVVAAVEQSGLRVGQEVDVFAKEAFPFLKLFRADILTISEQIGAAGDFLAQAVIQAVRDPDQQPMQRLETPVEGAD